MSGPLAMSAPARGLGSLTVVGTGFGVAGQVTAETEAVLQQADRVFFVCGDPATRLWLEQTHPGAESLYDAYRPGRPRRASYDDMVARIVAPLDAGQRVCAAFYGHPGVFVRPSHAAIRHARAAGHRARMLPAVSAEDCLFADLAIDPAAVGCQSYEATHFLLYRPRFDVGSALVLWQIGAIGVDTYETTPLWSRDGLALLTEVLTAAYPHDHEVVIYEGATLPLCPPRVDRVPLAALPDAHVTTGSTLYVPPRRRPALDAATLERLGMAPPAAEPMPPPAAEPAVRPGRLTLVGTGYNVAGQIDASSLAHMRLADHLFYLLSDPATCQYVRSLNDNATDLGDCYRPGESGAVASRRMAERLRASVARGQRVTAAFNGHPAIGLFPAHLALAHARAAGHDARMLPAVSFEDCLIADLGIDPAIRGRMLYDATEWLIRPRSLEPTASLVLLQVGAIARVDYRDSARPARHGLRLLRERLATVYPLDHRVTIYEIAQLPFVPPRIDTVPLDGLDDASVTVRSTLYVPPAQAPRADPRARQRLAERTDRRQSR